MNREGRHRREQWETNRYQIGVDRSAPPVASSYQIDVDRVSVPFASTSAPLPPPSICIPQRQIRYHQREIHVDRIPAPVASTSSSTSLHVSRRTFSYPRELDSDRMIAPTLSPLSVTERRRSHPRSEDWFDTENAAVSNHGRRSPYNQPLSSPVMLSQTPGPTKNTIKRKVIEVAPGTHMLLRGAEETWEAVRRGFYCSTVCLSCSEVVFCIQDANSVICPKCRVVSPVEESERRAPPTSGVEYNDMPSVGLGFSFHDLQSWIESSAAT